MALPRLPGTSEELAPSLAAFPNACNVNVHDLKSPPETGSKPKRSVWDRAKGLVRNPSSPPPKADKPGKTDRERPVTLGHVSIPVNIIVRHICWMYGHVGCGKSAIAQNVAEELAENGKLGASFFFFRNAGNRSSMNGLPSTLAHQISQNIPGTRPLIESIIREDRSLLGQARSLASQLEDLVFKPCLKALCAGDLSAHVRSPYVIVIDGLDECDDKEGVETFIDYAITFFTRHPTIPLRLFITSRIEEHIRTRLDSKEIHLLDLNTKFRREDLALYMKATFSKAAQQDRALRTQGGTWPEAEELNKLIDYCDGSFIIGSTLIKFILGDSGDNDPRTPMERLPLALEISHGLDGVYLQILSRSQYLPHFHLIISTLAAMQEPLSVSGLSALLYVSTYEVVRVLVNLQAIIQVPGRDDDPVTLFHTSLRDFLVDESRSGDFYVPPSHHTFLTYRCLSLLFGPHPSSSKECCRYAIIWWATHWASALTMDPSFGYEEFETPERWLDALHQPAGEVSQLEEFHLPDIEIFLIGKLSTLLFNHVTGGLSSYDVA
ncbi:hypothetical protein EST38_g4741 [Candolleomyces aberdarensis]|uniref:Nephrocystin 3-like N-terminal domain-containing protein n=1 Tax=Candolleomyces aberdarensis TaxID=2316362 RepID=A0A4Q2DQ78_9AGAR|nr:hypothetical protein EST38_g4741 [Candolleomyces aberdarensis]